ncbi:MAG: glycosyltransferase [Myxococcota bacterium]
MAAAPMPSAPDADAHLFEISWEACHQVGGIYQVLRSKARSMRQRWDDRYLLVGPLIPALLPIELELEPAGDWLDGVVKELRERGLGVEHGRWMVAGRPRVLLVDSHAPPDRIEMMRHRMHRDYGVPPDRGNALVDGVLAFAEGVRSLLEVVSAHAGERPLLAHFHEWLSSASLPVVRRELPRIATVFTTHATSVGRYLASSGEDLYDRLGALDADREADRFGIATQHAIERISAREAHVLTTVSPITGEECEHLLGRAPDVVTPNGLDMARFDLGQDFHTFHGQYKESIHRFVMGHFFPSYSFDLDRTLYLFNAGRFEPRNKGFDLCLESAARLNAELRADGTDLTVVLFLVTSRSCESLDPGVLHSRGLLDDLEEASQRITQEVGQRLFRRSAAGETPTLDSLVDEYWRLRHRRLQHAFAREEDPPLCTHVLPDAERDPILAHLRHLGLANRPEDRVKVVYHPEFISSVNPVWGMDYDQFVRGCHLGVFPSSYEPWGYTPLECLAMGVPAITSDLAGFGRYAADAFQDHDAWGLSVLPRRGVGYHDAAAELTGRLLDFCRLDRTARSQLRGQVEAHSRAFDWSRLAGAYHTAHDQALAAREK